MKLALGMATEPLDEAFLSGPDGYSVDIGHDMHGAVCEVGKADSHLMMGPGSFSYFLNVNWNAQQEAKRAMNG